MCRSYKFSDLLFLSTEFVLVGAWLQIKYIMMLDNSNLGIQRRTDSHSNKYINQYITFKLKVIITFTFKQIRI